MIEIKQPPLEVNPDNPFEGDVLNRAEEVENLSNLITNIGTPFVLSITPPWGTGKTTFSLMLKSHLKQQEILSLYFICLGNRPFRRSINCVLTAK